MSPQDKEPKDMELSFAKRELLTEIIASEKDYYAEECDVWRDIERKAQGTIAICGILLAGILGFIRLFLSDPIQPPGIQDGQFWVIAPLLIKYALILSVLSLGISIWLSLHSLRVLEVEQPPFCGAFRGMAEDLIAHEDLADPKRVENLYHDQISCWAATNESINAANAKKAKDLIRSQWVLLGGVVLAISIPLITVWMT